MRPLFRRVLEVFDAFPDPAADLRQAARPEDQDDDREDDEKLRDTDTHRSP
jgi:hypothetical protein